MLKEHLKKHFKRIQTIKLKRHHYILGGFGIAAIIAITSIFGFQNIGTHAKEASTIDNKFIEVNSLVQITETDFCDIINTTGINKNETGEINIYCMLGDCNTEPVSKEILSGYNEKINITNNESIPTCFVECQEGVEANENCYEFDNNFPKLKYDNVFTFTFEGISAGTSDIKLLENKITNSSGNRNTEVYGDMITIEEENEIIEVSCDFPGETINVYEGAGSEISLTCNKKDLPDFNNIRDIMEINIISGNDVIEKGISKKAERQDETNTTYILTFTGNNIGEVQITNINGTTLNYNGTKYKIGIKNRGNIKVNPAKEITCKWLGGNTDIHIGETGAMQLQCDKTEIELQTEQIWNNLIYPNDGTKLKVTNVQEEGEFSNEIRKIYKVEFKGIGEGTGNLIISGIYGGYNFTEAQSETITIQPIETPATPLKCTITASGDNVYVNETGNIIVSCDIVNKDMSLTGGGLDYSGNITVSETSTRDEDNLRFIFTYTGVIPGHSHLKLKENSISGADGGNNEAEYATGITVNEPIPDCNPDWNNDYFITPEFRALNPTSGQIACALYGNSGEDETAYTMGWEDYKPGVTCSGFDEMKVEELTTLESTALEENTIYVLTSTGFERNNTITLPSCSAIISKQENGTTIGFNDIIDTDLKDGIKINENYGILDNISLYNHNIYNRDGINIQGSSNTLNMIKVYNRRHNGIDIALGHYNKLNNIQVFGNEYIGIAIMDTSTKNTISNTQIYANDGGIYIVNSNENIIQNVEVYENRTGINVYYGTGNTFEDIELYYNDTNIYILSGLQNNGYGNLQQYPKQHFFENSGELNDIERGTTKWKTEISGFNRVYSESEQMTRYEFKCEGGWTTGYRYTGSNPIDLTGEAIQKCIEENRGEYLYEKIKEIDRGEYEIEEIKPILEISEGNEPVYLGYSYPNYITNPRINNNKYYFERTSSTSHAITEKIKDYSYGYEINKQKDVKLWNSQNGGLVTGDYFIGSNVKKYEISGNIDKHTKVYYTITGTATDTGEIKKYNIYRIPPYIDSTINPYDGPTRAKTLVINRTNHLTEIDINSGVEILIKTGDTTTYPVIVQMYGDTRTNTNDITDGGYFAEHRYIGSLTRVAPTFQVQPQNMCVKDGILEMTGTWNGYEYDITGFTSDSIVVTDNATLNSDFQRVSTGVYTRSITLSGGTGTITVNSGITEDILEFQNTQTYTKQYYRDIYAPHISTDEFTIPECTRKILDVDANDEGCAGISGYKLEGELGNIERQTGHILRINTGTIGRTGRITKTGELYVRDHFENTGSRTIEGTITDIEPDVSTGISSNEPYNYQTAVSGSVSINNVIERLGATEGVCGDEDLNVTEIVCTEGADGDVIGSYGIQVTVQPEAENILCEVRIEDNENSHTTGYIKFTIDEGFASERLKCKIDIEPTTLRKGNTGLITLTCSGTNRGDLDMNKLDYSGTIIEVANPTTPLLANSKVYEMIFTGTNAGNTRFGIKTGAITYGDGNIENSYIPGDYISVYTDIFSGCTWGNPTPNPIGTGVEAYIDLICGDHQYHAENANLIWNTIEFHPDSNSGIIAKGEVDILEGEGVRFHYTGAEIGEVKLFASGDALGYLYLSNEESPLIIVTGAKPTINIISTETLNSNTQTATGTCTDSLGIVGYYWGTNSTPSNNDYTPIESQTSFSKAEQINTSGTYYFACKNTAGNTEIASITYVAYQTKNMLDKIDGTTGTYTTANYDLDSTTPNEGHYIIPQGTDITLQELCTRPGIPSSLQITSVGEPSTQNATRENQANASNTTYACWYDRDTYTLTLVPGTGIASVNGAGTYKHGKTVEISAQVEAGYNFLQWFVQEGVAPTSQNESTANITMTQNTTLQAIANAEGALSCSRLEPTKLYIKQGDIGTITLKCNYSIGISTTEVNSDDILQQYEYAFTRSNDYLILSDAVVGGTTTDRTFTFTYEAKPDVNGAITLVLPIGIITGEDNSTTIAPIQSPKIIVDSIKPICEITNQPTETVIAVHETGTIAFECVSTGTKIITSTLSSGAVQYEEGIVDLELISANKINGTETGRKYVFKYTGKANGSTTFKLKSGQVSDQSLNTNEETDISNEVKVYYEIINGCTWGEPTYNPIGVGVEAYIDLLCTDYEFHADNRNAIWNVIQFIPEENSGVIRTGEVDILTGEGVRFHYTGAIVGEVSLLASGDSEGYLYITETPSSVIKVIDYDSNRPNCRLENTEMVTLGQTGSISVICESPYGILTTGLTNGELEYSGNIIVGNSDIIEGTGNKTFNFIFTGDIEGQTSIALKTGAVKNVAGIGNAYKTGHDITVVTGANGVHYCSRKDPSNTPILRDGTGTMILDCIIDERIPSFLESDNNHVTGTLALDNPSGPRILYYTGVSTGATRFAISGTIGNVIIQSNTEQSNDIRSKEIKVIESGLILELIPQESGWTNSESINVQMEGRNAIRVKYYQTGAEGITGGECDELGTELNQLDTTFTGSTTVNEEGITHIYLCGEGPDGTGMIIGNYKIDRTGPTGSIEYINGNGENGNSCTTGTVTIKLVTGDNISGYPELAFARNSTGDSAWTSNNTRTVSENESGTGYIRDNAGNILSLPYNVTGIVSEGPTEPNLIYPNGEEIGNTNTEFSWTESQASGCAEISGYIIHILSGSQEIWSWPTTSTNINPGELNLDDGTYSRYVVAYDNFDQTGQSNYGTFTINSEIPTCDIEYTPGIGMYTSGNVMAILTGCSEGATGFNATGHEFTENGEFRFTFTNGHGVPGHKTGNVRWIDRTPPFIVGETITTTGWYTTGLIYNFSYDDTGSSISGQDTISCTINTEGTGQTCSITDVNICDNAGNCNTDEVTSQGINIDMSDPICGTWSYVPNSGTQTTGNVEVTLTGSYDTISQINVSGGSCTITGNNQNCNITISDNAGNTGLCTSDTVTWIGIDKPILHEVAPIGTTTDTTPNYIFSSTQTGTITYSGECSSVTTGAITGNNRITLNELAYGTYSGCTITVTNASGVSSDPLTISTFTIRRPSSPNGPQKDYCPDGDFSDSYYDGTCEGPKDICGVSDSKYNTEMQTAYLYAYLHGMTTICPIDDANLYGYIRRDELAKMLVQYSLDVLDLEPQAGKSGCMAYDDIDNSSAEMKYYMKTACELNIMGLQSDGKTPLKSFYPQGLVTRAEFGTTLSRLIYGDAYNLESESENTYPGAWYGKHLAALKRDEIMTQIYGDRPQHLELRGYVMLMLMRHGKARLDNVKDSDVNPSNEIVELYHKNNELTCEISYHKSENEHGSGMLYFKDNKLREDYNIYKEGTTSLIIKNNKLYVRGSTMGSGQGLVVDEDVTAIEELESILDDDEYSLKNCNGAVKNITVFETPTNIKFKSVGDRFTGISDFIDSL